MSPEGPWTVRTESSALLARAEAGLAAIESGVQRPFRQVWYQTGCVQGLHFLWLEITRSCNLACTHCYVGSGPHLPVQEQMEFTDWMRTLSEARQLGCRRVQFIGGEPTLHPDLIDLIEYAKSLGIRRLEMFTNAMDLSSELIRCLERNRVTVAFSFYTTDPSTHDRITGVPGSFEECVAGVTKLSRSRLRLRAGIIQIKQSAREIADAKRLLRRLGVFRIGVDRVRGVGRGAGLRPDKLPEEELCGQCWRRLLCVTATGTVYPCVFSRFAVVGNVLTDSLDSIVKSQQLHAFRRANYLGP